MVVGQHVVEDMGASCMSKLKCHTQCQTEMGRLPEELRKDQLGL